mmetsp:Transcript_25344/g.53542  ORF Transcript_25344/g.53542 Transcript_25344/m.53542 type:complete len:118 (-) Transcript_25344:31-384(-)
MKKSVGIKFMKKSTYLSYLEEIDCVDEKLSFRNERMNEQTVEAEVNRKEIESIRREWEELVSKGNELFNLDKYCAAKCVWAFQTSCESRAHHLMTMFGMKDNASKIKVMSGVETCTH